MNVLITNETMHTQDLNMVLVAGESSGDQLGAVLLQGAQANFAHTRSAGIIGDAMHAQGAQVWWPAQSLAVRGYFEPLRHLPRIIKMRRELIQRVTEIRPNVFIGIDAPDFNLGVEREIRAQGIPTMHYISPSIWAWRPKRIEKIRQAANHVLLIFPFEKEIYQKAGIPATYVGHPFAPQIAMHTDTQKARNTLSLAQHRPTLAILPGSRASEIRYNAPSFFQAARIWAQKMGVQAQVIVPIAHPHLETELRQIQAEQAPELTVFWYSGQAREVMAAADVTLVASGTASLEVALHKKPSVISYQTSWVSAQLYPHFALQPWIGLPNILLQESFIPEVLQIDATPERLAQALLDEMERYATDASVQERLCQLHASLIADTPNLCAQAIQTVCEQRRA